MHSVDDVFYRRRKRRARKKVRQITATLGGLGMVIAIGAGGLALHTKNDRMLIIAGGYSVVSLLFLFISWIFMLLSRSTHAKSRHMSRETATEDDGMALIAVLLMLALVGALTVQAQAAAAVRLGYARAQHDIAQLRVAATDAALYAVRTRVTSADDEDLADRSIELPSGITTVTGLEKLTSVPELAPALIPVLPGDGKVFLIHSSADRNGRSQHVACMAHSKSGQAARILAWVESR